MRIRRCHFALLHGLWFALALCLGARQVHAASDTSMAFVAAQIAAHPGESGAYVLDTGDEALIARAWLTTHAQRTLDVQYFIWSTDNIGILAAEAVLRAAERGVRVRIIVDDLMMDAPDMTLLALARHPLIDIRIYNPKHSVSVTLPRRLLNLVTDFRGVNQRMHDKLFIVDGQVAITGGRNMAAEYYDYSHEYNFRDRDALLAGAVVHSMQTSFDRFWHSELTQPVEMLLKDSDAAQFSKTELNRIYRELHAYAASTENYSAQVRSAIDAAPTAFPRLAAQTVWGRVDFVSDQPGKNAARSVAHGGGLTSQALSSLIRGARRTIAIQSPYLVMSDDAQQLFAETCARGVQVRINTNSLASTDNMQAFSGYRNQRAELLGMGLQIYEYRPDAKVAREVFEREITARGGASTVVEPVHGLHAKTMVVDSERVFIGTFNLDPRSENLNTETGVIIHNAALARAVETAMEIDMQHGNSWSAALDDPDRNVSWLRRGQVRFWQLMPLRSLL